MAFTRLKNLFNKKFMDELNRMLDELFKGGGVINNSVGKNQLANDFNFIAVYETDIDPRTLTKNGYYLLIKNSYIPSEFGSSCILEFVNGVGWKELRITSLPLTTAIRTLPRYTFKFRNTDTSEKIAWESDPIAKDSVATTNIKNGAVDSTKLSDAFNFVGLFTTDIDPLTFTKNGRYLVINNSNLPPILKGQGIIEFNNNYNWLEYKLTGLPTTFEQKTAPTFEFRVNKGTNPTKIEWVSEFDKPDIVSGKRNVEDSTINGANFTTEIRNDLGFYEKLDIVEQQGYLTYASTSVHTINASTGFRTLVTECSKGDAFSIDVEVNSSTTSSCIFWDKDGKYMIDLDRGAGKRLYNHEVTPPLGAAYMSVTSVWAGNPPLYPAIRKFKTNSTNEIISTTSDLDKRLTKFEKQELEIKDGFLTYASTNVTTIRETPDFKTIVADVKEGEFWNVDTTLNGSTTSAVIFWDKDGKFFKDLERGTKGDVVGFEFEIPKGVFFASTTSLNNGLIPVLRKGTKGNIAEIERRLNIVEEEIQPKDNILWATMGDSITAGASTVVTIAKAIEKKTGIKTTNMGFGGCMMAQRIDRDGQHQWDAFGFHALAYGIGNKDFSVQENILANTNTLPAYFRQHFYNVRDFDWDADNIILTIAYGTNDYTYSDGGSKIIINDENDLYNNKSFTGAARRGIENIWKRNPKIKIMLVGPTYRFWLNDDLTFLEDSNTKEINGQMLPDFSKALHQVAKDYGTPFINLYEELGINKYNRFAFYEGKDGTHPVVSGNYLISGFMVGSYKLHF